MDTMKDRDATFRERVERERHRRARLYFILRGEVLFSDAFRKIARYGSAVTAYLLILSRQPLPPRKKEIERLRRAGLWPPAPSTFSFPIREARHHGLTEKALSGGLRRLHEVGLLDIVRHGSARRGDFTLYRFSERWRKYGRDDFEQCEWPHSRTLSVRDKETGKFVKTRTGKKQAVALLKNQKAYGDYYKHGNICRYRAVPSPSNHGESCDYSEVVAAKPAALESLVVADPSATRNVDRDPWAEEEPLVADFGEWDTEVVQ
jgi:hypothetical protein